MLLVADLESLLASDEEEFPNDDILQDLRHRRALYMQKLREMDSVLQDMHQH